MPPIRNLSHNSKSFLFCGLFGVFEHFVAAFDVLLNNTILSRPLLLFQMLHRHPNIFLTARIRWDGVNDVFLEVYGVNITFSITFYLLFLNFINNNNLVHILNMLCLSSFNSWLCRTRHLLRVDILSMKNMLMKSRLNNTLSFKFCVKYLSLNRRFNVLYWLGNCTNGSRLGPEGVVHWVLCSFLWWFVNELLCFYWFFQNVYITVFLF